jgi:mandelate racemase
LTNNNGLVWQHAAGLAAAYRREVSSHLFPEVSAPLRVATPGRHRLEYVDWADPILQEPLQIKDGMAVIPGRPGNGLAWNEEAVARYRLT